MWGRDGEQEEAPQLLSSGDRQRAGEPHTPTLAAGRGNRQKQQQLVSWTYSAQHSSTLGRTHTGKSILTTEDSKSRTLGLQDNTAGKGEHAHHLQASVCVCVYVSPQLFP